MDTKIIIESLTRDSVSIKTQKYFEAEGHIYEAGVPHRCAYTNSDRGRPALMAEVPEPYLSAIMAVWGDAPTMPKVDVE